jgi:hypothetical protein
MTGWHISTTLLGTIVVLCWSTRTQGDWVSPLCLHRTAPSMGLAMAEPCILLTVKRSERKPHGTRTMLAGRLYPFSS